MENTLPKITLINTPKRNYNKHFEKGINDLEIDKSYPVGLLYISSSIKKTNRFIVDYLDASFYHMNIENIINHLKKEKPTYVGLNSTFPNLNIVSKLSKTIKKELNNTQIIVGGPAATLYSENIIKNKSIDFIVRGEGEKTIVDLLDGIEQKKDLKKINGITYISNNQIIMTKEQQKININDLPLLDVENIPIELKENSKEIYLFTSRGCTSNCNYCSTPTIWGKGKKNLRKSKTERIFQEIDLYKEKNFKFETVHFIDDNFTNDWNKLEDFMNRWNKKYTQENLTWRCLSRIKEINSDYKLKKMEESNCIQVSVGVESASNKILKEIGKGIKIQEVDNFLDKIKNTKIKTKGFFMIGFPNETEEDLTKTLNYAANSSFDEIAINIVKAYPKTRLYTSIYGDKEFLPNYKNNISHNSQRQKYNADPSISLSKISINKLIELKNETIEKFYDKK